MLWFLTLLKSWKGFLFFKQPQTLLEAWTQRFWPGFLSRRVLLLAMIAQTLSLFNCVFLWHCFWISNMQPALPAQKLFSQTSCTGSCVRSRSFPSSLVHRCSVLFIEPRTDVWACAAQPDQTTQLQKTQNSFLPPLSTTKTGIDHRDSTSNPTPHTFPNYSK